MRRYVPMSYMHVQCTYERMYVTMHMHIILCTNIYLHMCIYIYDYGTVFLCTLHVCSLYRNAFSGPHLSHNATMVSVRVAILPTTGMYIAIQLATLI